MKKKAMNETVSRDRLAQKGLFLVIEGIDGSGKSTQVELLASRLRRRGFQVVTLREPTQGKWGRKIRELSRTSGSIKPEEELELFIRDRRENVTRNIKPALEAGKIVILDRYYFSTLAYQGARGLPLEEIRRRHQKFAIVPDLVIILDVPVRTGLNRIKDRLVIYSLFEEKEYLKKVRKIFLSLCDPEVVVVDGRPPAAVIHRKIWSLLLKKFPGLK